MRLVRFTLFALMVTSIAGPLESAVQPPVPSRRQIGLKHDNLFPSITGTFLRGEKDPPRGGMYQALVNYGGRSVVVLMRDPADEEVLKLVRALDARPWERDKARVYLMVFGGDPKDVEAKCKGLERTAVYLATLQAAAVWRAFEVDRDVAAPVLLMDMNIVRKSSFEARQQLTDARLAELVKEAETFLSPPKVKPVGPFVSATMQAHPDGVTHVIFSPDGKWLVSGGLDRRIKVWDAATMKEKAVEMSHPVSLSSIALSPDGKTIASAGHDRTARLWDVATGKEVAVIKEHPDSIRCVRISPDGKSLATGSHDNTVRIWDVATGREKAVLRGHKDRVHAIAFSPDGKLLVSGGSEGNIKLWDVAEGKEKATWPGHTNTVECLTFSPNGKLVASGGREERGKTGPGKARLWDVATGKEPMELESRINGVLAVAFAPDGKTLAIAGESPWVKLLDLSTGKEKETLKDHGSAVLALAFSPDGKTLATGCWDAKIRLWDLNLPKEAAPKP